MSKYNLAALQEAAQQEMEEAEKKQSNREGLPLVYPVENGTFRIKLLYNPKANIVQRKIIRHPVGKDKIPCLSVYGEECPICKAINNAEDEFGKECGAWNKYGAKTRGLSMAILVDHDKNMFKDEKSPKKGDTFLFMYPPTLYNKINEILVKAGSHIESLVAENNGKTIEVTRKQKAGGFPDYEIAPYAYGDDKIKETDEEFDELLDNLPDLNVQLAPNHPDEETLNKAKAAAEAIDAEYASGKVLDPTNPPEEKSTESTSIKEEVKGSIASKSKSASKPEGVPDCFGNHDETSPKCLVCDAECDCIIADGNVPF